MERASLNRSLYSGPPPEADYDNLPEGAVVASGVTLPEAAPPVALDDREQPSHQDLINNLTGTHMAATARPGEAHPREQEVLAVASYDDCTVPMLRNEMRERGISYTGMNKAEMVKALDQDDEANAYAEAE